MFVLYFADVAANLRLFAGVVVAASSIVGLFAFVTAPAYFEGWWQRMVAAAAVAAFLSGVVLVLTPTRQTLLQLGDLVPVRQHQSSYGDDCKHVIWVTRENSQRMPADND